MKRLLVMSLALMFCMIATNVFSEDNTVEVGNTITFGVYEQDNDVTNGKEPIEWIILDKSEDGSLLLISRYALDAKPYNNEQKSVTWESCSLRHWLNDDFYSEAFSDLEQLKIIPVVLQNEENPYSRISGGIETQDKVWLLSINEAVIYFSSDTARMCAPTKYVVAHGAKLSYDHSIEGIGSCEWWLRSPGGYKWSAAYINHNGSIYVSGGHVSDAHNLGSHSVSVRPVISILP